jgi:uncharacterized protein (DUF302 family)/organic hydroperoxide reductase OsmC/OhrA
MEFDVHLAQIRDFEFRVHFPATNAEDITVDEPPPLGKARGPNPARLLAAAVANCLAASLYFCLRKALQETGPIVGDAKVALVRNKRGRWRVGSLAVTLKLADTMQSLPSLAKCLEQFEDFCIVTESVRRGIPVAVSVIDRDGHPLAPADRNGETPQAGYYIGTTIDGPFDAVVARVIEGLKAQEFGVLTDIDIQAAMKAKLGAEMPRYRILGACNPRFAHEALKLESKLGVLLPCNVIVRETADGRVEVASVDPVTAMDRTGNRELESTAHEIRKRLQEVIDTVA